jgi:hypothetical protein
LRPDTRADAVAGEVVSARSTFASRPRFGPSAAVNAELSVWHGTPPPPAVNSVCGAPASSSRRAVPRQAKPGSAEAAEGARRESDTRARSTRLST